MKNPNSSQKKASFQQKNCEDVFEFNRILTFAFSPVAPPFLLTFPESTEPRQDPKNSSCSSIGTKIKPKRKEKVTKAIIKLIENGKRREEERVKGGRGRDLAWWKKGS